MAIPIVQTDTNIAPMYFVNQQNTANSNTNNGFTKPNANTTNRATGNLLLPVFNTANNGDNSDDVNIAQNVNNPVDTNTGSNILLGSGLGVGAIGLVLLPDFIKKLTQNKELTSTQVDFVKRFSNGKILTPQEANRLKENATKLFTQLTANAGVEGRKMVAELPMVKQLLKSYHPHDRNYQEALDSIYRNLVFKVAQVKNNIVEYPRYDFDGNIAFKDFLNISSGAASMEADVPRLLLNYIVGSVQKEAGLHQLTKGLDINTIPLRQTALDLLQAGIFKELDRTDSKRAEKLLTSWSANEKKAYGLASDNVLTHYINHQNVFHGNTARAGETTETIKAVQHDPIWGLPEGRIIEALESGDHILGAFANPYTKMSYIYNVAAMSGPVFDNGRKIFNNGLWFALSNNMQRKLEDMGLPQLLQKANPRIFELKGILTGYEKELFFEYQKYKLNDKINLNSLSVDELKAEVRGIFKASLKKLNKNYETELSVEQQQAELNKLETEALKNADSKASSMDELSEAELRKFSLQPLALKYFHDDVQNGREEYSNPQSWSKNLFDVLPKKLIDIEYNRLQDTDVQKPISELLKKVRVIGEEDFKLIDEQSYYNKFVTDKDGQEKLVTEFNNSRDQKIQEENELMRTGKKQIPVSPELYKKIEALKAEAGKATTKDQKQAIVNKYEKLVYEAQKVDILSLTFHTLTADAQNVYATLKAQDKLSPEALGAGLKQTIIEVGKNNLISLFLELEKDPKAKKLLREMGVDVFIACDSGPMQFNVGKKALINVVNNSDGMPVATMLGDKNLKDIQGVKDLILPFAAYMELPTGVKLDKAGNMIVAPPWSVIERMAGDSKGSDMGAIVYNILNRVLATGRAARKMIKDGALQQEIFDQLNLYHKSNQTLLKKAEKLVTQGNFSFQGSPEEKAKALELGAKNSDTYQTALKQVLSNSIRWAEVYNDTEGNEHYLGEYLDTNTEYKSKLKAIKAENLPSVEENKLTKKLLEETKSKLGIKYKFIGTDAAEVLGENNLVFNTKEQAQAAVNPLITGVLMKKITKADDTSPNIAIDAITNSVIHGDNDTLWKIIEQGKEGKALDAMGFEGRLAYGNGMPPGSLVNNEKWMPKILKNMNVYHPLHKALRSVLPAYMTGVQAGGLLAAAAGIGISTITAYNLYQHEKEEQEDLNPTPASSTNRQTNSTLQSDFHMHLNSAANSTINNAGNQVLLASKKQDDANNSDDTTQSTLGNLSLTALDTGIFLQNLGWLAKSVLASAYPQPLLFLGSSTNILSTFLPDQYKLPVFVLGTALNMGAWAANQTHTDQADPNPLWATRDNFDRAIKAAKHNSVETWDQKEFVGERDGKKFGFMHRIFPGAVAAEYRRGYFNTYEKLQEKKVPALIASSYANVKMLGKMNWDMLTNWRYAHDMLGRVDREEFVRGTRLKMPNSRFMLLALGSGVPVISMGIASIFAMLNKKKDLKEVKSERNKYISSLPTDVKEKVIAIEQAKEIAKEIDTQNDVHQGPMELAANVSSMIPAASLMIYAGVISKAGFGTPFYTVPQGINMQRKITPKINGRLIGWGSAGALAATTVSALSTAGIMPAFLSHIVDPLYIGFQSIVGAGQARNSFESEFSPALANQFFPKQGMLEHMKQIAEAKSKGWFKFWAKERVPVHH